MRQLSISFQVEGRKLPRDGERGTVEGENTCQRLQPGCVALFVRLGLSDTPTDLITSYFIRFSKASDREHMRPRPELPNPLALSPSWWAFRL